MFQDKPSTAEKGSPVLEEEEQGKESQPVNILKLPSIRTILTEQDQSSIESERKTIFSQPKEKARVHSELRLQLEATSPVQPLSEQAKPKTSERSFLEYKTTSHLLPEEATRGFEMPPLKSTTTYSQRTFQLSEPGEYSVIRKAPQVKEETTERMTVIYPGSGASASSGYPEPNKKSFTGARSISREPSKIPRLRIAPISEERKTTVKSVSLSSSDWRDVGEGSFDSHSLEEHTAFVEPRPMFASTSTSKQSHVLSEQDKHALRLMRNRLSAERSRNRKRQRMQTLEQEVHQREETIRLLKEDLNALLRYVERLEAFCKVLDVPSSELTKPELHYKP